MAYMEKFLGIQEEIPEDRRYIVKPGLWAKREAQEISFGFSQPTFVLAGGLNDLECIPVSGNEKSKGVLHEHPL